MLAKYPTLISSDASLSRVPRKVAGIIGLAARKKPKRLRGITPESIFEPCGTFLTAGYQEGITVRSDEAQGSHAILEARLPAENTGNRAELIPLSRYLLEGKFSYFHTPMSYSFDLFLHDSSLRDRAYQCLAQWHGVPNILLGGRHRHAPFLLGIANGEYFCVSAATSNLVPRRTGNRDALSGLQRVRRISLKAAQDDVARWVSWRLDVCWCYTGQHGWWRLFRDGSLLAHDTGPNCYNEVRGAPYFQFGVYRLPQKKYFERNSEVFTARSYRNIRISFL